MRTLQKLPLTTIAGIAFALIALNSFLKGDTIIAYGSLAGAIIYLVVGFSKKPE